MADQPAGASGRAGPRDLQHPLFARFYERISEFEEGHGGREHREQLLAPLSGKVIEIGAGNALNFRYYPATVTSVLAVEPDDRLRAKAEEAAAQAKVPVEVVPGRAEQLPAGDGEYDAAVFSLVLCSLPDTAAALTEARRVLAPTGILRFYEHVRAPRRVEARLQDVVQPLWSRVFAGCHPNRDTASAIRGAGFELDELEEFRFGLPHILGSARPK